MTLNQVQCPICRSEPSADLACTHNYITKNSIFSPCNLISCHYCKSSWVLNTPSSKKLKKYYGNGFLGINPEKKSTTLERCQALARWRYVLNALEDKRPNWLNQTMSVCDIGAGYGCTYEIAKQQRLSIDYIAYETTDRVDRIRDLGAHVLGDFFEEKSNRQFDLVWASHILEHFSDPDVLLKEMRSILKPDGFGFIEVPCLDHEFKLDFAPHLLFFSVQGLRIALERNGFEVISIDSVGKLRSEARDLFERVVREDACQHTIPNRLKRVLKTLIAKSLGSAYRGRSSLKKETTVFKDLQNESLFKEWGLESYGGERCWIRSIFKPKLL